MIRLVRTCLLVAVLAAVTGCSGDLFSSGQQGFVSAEGSIEIRPVEEREPPKPIVGTTLEGDEVDLAALRGSVVVMPVWGSWCGPCRKEAPMFAAAAADLADEGVRFLGLNVRDTSRDNALGLVRTSGMNYPSIYDPAGSLLLNFEAGFTPSRIPSVAFIDAEGRVAAAVLGEITRSTLYAVLEDITGKELGAPAPAETP